MARIPYYPYNEDYASIFNSLGLSYTLHDFGGNQGWTEEDFKSLIELALAKFDALYDDDDESNDPDESWYTLLQTELTPRYWSVEGTHVG